MNDDLVELCPICIENPAEYYTECGHCYCIGCLSRINKCAMCRKSLLRAKICVQIKQKVKLIQPSGVADINSIDVRIYSTNYNVLRLMAGMGGLTYST